VPTDADAMRAAFRVIEGRVLPPRPWVDANADTFPWSDEAFGERLLAEHLSQEHEAASRPLEVIRAHVDALVELLGLRSGEQVLDVTCGPGLYCHELARRGLECTGVDWSPAAMRYAVAVARAEGLPCHFSRRDVRTMDYEQQFDAAILLYHQFQTFAPPDASRLLRVIARALRPGGRLLLELKSEQQSRASFASRQSWRVSGPNLLHPGWHLELYEAHWDEASRTEVDRWYVLSLEDGSLVTLATSLHVYTEDEIAGLLRTVGFPEVTSRLSWPTVPSGELLVVARRP